MEPVYISAIQLKDPDLRKLISNIEYVNTKLAVTMYKIKNYPGKELETLFCYCLKLKAFEHYTTTTYTHDINKAIKVIKNALRTKCLYEGCLRLRDCIKPSVPNPLSKNVAKIALEATMPMFEDFFKTATPVSINNSDEEESEHEETHTVDDGNSENQNTNTEEITENTEEPVEIDDDDDDDDGDDDDGINENVGNSGETHSNVDTDDEYEVEDYGSLINSVDDLSYQDEILGTRNRNSTTVDTTPIIVSQSNTTNITSSTTTTTTNNNTNANNTTSVTTTTASDDNNTSRRTNLLSLKRKRVRAIEENNDDDGQTELAKALKLQTTAMKAFFSSTWECPICYKTGTCGEFAFATCSHSVCLSCLALMNTIKCVMCSQKVEQYIKYTLKGSRLMHNIVMNRHMMAKQVFKMHLYDKKPTELHGFLFAKIALPISDLLVDCYEKILENRGKIVSSDRIKVLKELDLEIWSYHHFKTYEQMTKIQGDELIAKPNYYEIALDCNIHV